MNSFHLSIFFAFLHTAFQNPIDSWTLSPNILVLEVNGSVGQHPLTCVENTTIHHQDIFWKKNGVVQKQGGNTLMVKLEESLGGGNYTCHSAGGLILNHTVVLIQEKEKKRIIVEDDNNYYVKCFAQNYSGSFQCSWTWDKNRMGQVAFIKAGRFYLDPSFHVMFSSSHNTFLCRVDDSGNAISCQDKQHCPYAEERRKIRLTLLVRSQYFHLENYSQQFRLSEIVKPDKITIRKVNTSLIELSYPRSWSHPHSYFPLTFQIAQFRGRCKDCGKTYATNDSKILGVDMSDISQFPIKRRARSVCVRAKDAFCNSPWSEWSYIRLKRNNKKNKRSKTHENGLF